MTQVIVQRSTKTDARSDERVEEFCNLVYDLCHSSIHAKYPKRIYMMIAGDLYTVKANYPTGYISVKALEMLNHPDPKKRVQRSKLTHEHFNSRSKVSLDLISQYYSNKDTPRDFVIRKMVVVAKKGLRTHLVWKEENSALPAIVAKHPDAKWEDHYRLAGIVLVADPGVPEYCYIYDGVTYSTQVECAFALNISKSTVGKWVKKGHIQKVKVCDQTISLNDYRPRMCASSPMTTSPSTSPRKIPKRFLSRSSTSLERFFAP